MDRNKDAESVIWIASYPKSGNTWVQNVIRVAGSDYGFPSKDLDVYKLKSMNQVPSTVGGVRKVVTETPVTVLKTHASYRKNGLVHPELGLKTVGFVYVVRNPLDVLLSYINFTRLQYEKSKNDREYQTNLFIRLLGFERIYSYDEWLEMRLEDIPRQNLDHALAVYAENNMGIPSISGMTGGGWLDHYQSWWRVRNDIPAVILKYEDLLASPDEFLRIRKLFRFSHDEIVNAVNVVNEKQRGLQYKNIFYNKMSAYYFKNFFSKKAVSDFLSRFELDLKKLGYQDLS